MDGVEKLAAGENSKNAGEPVGGGAAKAAGLRERLERLLRSAAEVEVELSRAEGAICGVPHYSVIESRAHELGRRLSRQCQQQQMNELAATAEATAACPACQARCEVAVGKRSVKTVDGETDLQETKGYCPCCRRAFFPSSPGVGF